MVTTRAGDHAADANGKTDAPPAAAGEKHGIETDSANASPDAKRAKKSDDGTRQITLEETLEKKSDENAKPEKAEEKKGDEEPRTEKGEEKKEAADAEMKDAEAKPSSDTKTEEKEEKHEAPDTEMKDSEEKPVTETKPEKKEEQPATDKPAAEPERASEPSKATTGDSQTAEIPHKDTNVPSNVLEKGIIYFFIRARVNTEDQPEEVDDIARTHIILRPLAPDSKLGDGPIGDAGNTRLLALPKKVLPESGRDRFMAFVEKSGASFAELKEGFLSGADNQTKAGTSHSPAATPVGEGVYVVTSTGRETHLAYMLTLPSTPGEVQDDLGIKEQGSFILSTKNPKFPGPANARLPESPDFSEEIKNEFGDLRWSPTKPAHLDFANAQILMIGESSGIKKATEPRKKDVKEGKEDPKEVLEEIEEEDTKRMEHLAGDDSTAIFADLQARAKDYPKLQTTF
ncbi:hypothetical protein CPLU01_10159 [Colletotrichum plurivorum]|uniref:BTB domain transcription factor n=1 Tax=Colletotrichum plurivorum TaxID=2175906 RepID=A0A8H6K682_9PEZI|nr:hypothetical protein CPLU01_10159 [Colletotrichum plurivorum]